MLRTTSKVERAISERKTIQRGQHVGTVCGGVDRILPVACHIGAVLKQRSVRAITGPSVKHACAVKKAASQRLDESNYRWTIRRFRKEAIECRFWPLLLLVSDVAHASRDLSVVSVAVPRATCQGE